MTQRLDAQAGRHWDREAMVMHLYGLDVADGLETAHLEACQQCRAEWDRVQSRRSASLTSESLDENQLRKQRKAVFTRIERPSRPAPLWGLAPAAATALLLVMGIMTQPPRPAEPAQTAAITASDKELFNELNEMLSEDTPRGAAPIRALFSEQNNGEAQ
ncbi:MAG TPA: hypothetical protein PKJ41_17430 [Bryobacteraceae bacterium]|nr:hypothetical protein [Bryobacteraceae bacterium]HPT28128.1 hypothetical protein [Bryobacteraceae bacterium]